MILSKQGAIQKWDRVFLLAGWFERSHLSLSVGDENSGTVHHHLDGGLLSITLIYTYL